MTIFKFYFSVRSRVRWSPTRTGFIEKTNNKLRSTVTRVGLTSLYISLLAKILGETLARFPPSKGHTWESWSEILQDTTGIVVLRRYSSG